MHIKFHSLLLMFIYLYLENEFCACARARIYQRTGIWFTEILLAVFSGLLVSCLVIVLLFCSIQHKLRQTLDI